MGLKEVVNWLRKNTPTGIKYGILVGMTEVKYGTLETRIDRFTGREIKVVGFHNPWLNLPRYLESRWYAFLSKLFRQFWKPVRLLMNIESALAYARFGLSTGENDPDYLKQLIYFKLDRMICEMQDFISEEEQSFKTLMAAQLSMQHAIYGDEANSIYDSSESDKAFAHALTLIKDNYNTWWS